MSSRGCPEDVLQQAGQLWSMLDDLSQEDPEAYQRFIRRHVEEGLEFSAPPRVHCCLRTDILGPEKGVLYVNICSWKRVPAAQGPSAPVPVCGGRLETHTGPDGESYTVLDVAFSPLALRRAEGSRGGGGERGGGGGEGGEGEPDPQVCLLALSFAQRQHGLRLSEQYSRTAAGPPGCREDVHRRLGYRQPPAAATANATAGGSAPGGAPSPDAVSSPASLLQRISSLRMQEDTEDGDHGIMIVPKAAAAAAAAAAEQEQSENKKPLIQVISSTPQRPQAPRYNLLVIPGAEGGARDVVQLTAELPTVGSVSECQLSVSQTDVLLEVEDLYHLLVDLPETVDEDSASATFNKKERRLTLRLDVL